MGMKRACGPSAKQTQPQRKEAISLLHNQLDLFVDFEGDFPRPQKEENVPFFYKKFPRPVTWGGFFTT